MLRRTRGRRRLLTALPTLLVLLALTPLVAVAATDEEPLEDYSSYQPQTVCRDAVRAGTEALNRWVNRTFDGGRAVASLRSCSAGASEHKDGRAIDWSMDATEKRHRLEVNRFLDRLFASDAQGHEHSLARRMGIMYVIWNDRMYASYDRSPFIAREYLNSACPRLRRCSPTLRHRDHVHISLGKRGGRGATSWYAGRL